MRSWKKIALLLVPVGLLVLLLAAWPLPQVWAALWGPGQAAPVVTSQEEPQNQKPWIGISLANNGPRLKERLGLTTDQGVVITRVAPESPGARAGLAEKDVITAVDGAVVKAAGDVVKAVQAKKVEQQVTLTLLRGSQELTVVVTLGAAPQPPKPKPAPPPLGGFGDILGANPLEDLRSAKVELTDREGRKRTLEAVAGTVQAASATSLSLVPNGETAARTFQVTQETRTGFRARAEDLKAGDRVLVIAEDGKALSVVAGRSLAPRFWGFPFHRFMPWGGEPQPSPGKAF